MSIDYGNSVKKYMNQSALWQQCTGHDEYGKATYADGVEINVRKVPMQKLITDRHGKQRVSKTTILCSEDISVEDLIDGEIVVSVEDSLDRWGRSIAKAAFVE